MRPAGALILAVLLVGCGKKAPKEGRDRELARIADLLESGKYLGPGQNVSVRPLPAKAAADGPAYVWIEHVGMATIDAGKATLQRFADPQKRLLPPVVKAMAIDGGGDPIVVESKAVFRVHGGVREELGDPGIFDASNIGIAPDGTIWVGDRGQISHRQADGTWKVENVDMRDLTSLDFDGAGHVFATGRDRVLVREQGAWLPIVKTDDLGGKLGTKPIWQQTLVSPAGELWILSCDQLLRIANGKVTVQDLGKAGFNRGRFLGDTLVGLSCRNHVPVSISAAGELTALDPHPSVEGYLSAIDGRGRVWIAQCSVHLTVYDPKAPTTQWLAGSLPALGGAIAAFAVVGNGPRELPAPTPDTRATVTGRVLRAGQPIAHALIELCTQPLLPEPTPCAGDAGRLTGESDPTGTFTIRAPLRALRVVAKVEGYWYSLMNHECTGMEPEGTCDIGTLELSKTLNLTEPATGLRHISNHDP